MGRLIGYNWWRELIVSSLVYAELTWQETKEATGAGYKSETREFVHLNPRPTLKQFMIQLSQKE